MLKRVTCDAFKNQPTQFSAGLNVVLGSSSGSSNIGKSTFLLIIDFAFGGDDYVKIAKDAIARVDHHTIKIEFEFDGIPCFYTRSTAKPQIVFQCDSTYHNVIREMSIREYRQTLIHEYKVLTPEITMDGITKHFFRVYGRGNHNEHSPLSAERESQGTSVDYLMRLLDRYDAIESLSKAEKEIGSYGSRVESTEEEIRGKIQFCRESIGGYEERLESIRKRHQEANLRALGVDTEKAEKLAAATREYKKLDYQRSRLQSQLDAVRHNMPDSDFPLRKDFTALQRFFPEANIEALTDVEQFHAKMTSMMTGDIQSEIMRLELLVGSLNEQISKFEKQIEESGIVKDISQRILNEYARASRELNNAEAEINRLEGELQVIAQRKANEAKLERLRKKQETSLADAAKLVNDKMAEIMRVITGQSESGEKLPPILTLHPDKSYEFETPDVRGEGTAFEGVVIYDLSILALTEMPAIIHDSSIVKRIEDVDFERIRNLYQDTVSTGRQVFIAFDKADSYTPTAKEILEASAVLRLSVDDVLFGENWSRKATHNEEEEND